MHPKLGTKTFRVWVIIPLFLLFMTTGVKAESITQTITLSPGWNAIFLEVEPDNGPLPADVFGSILDPIIPDLISVWTWNPNTGTVEFIQNSEEVIPDQRNMLVYYTDPPPALESTMNSVPGNKAYLIQRGNGVPDYTFLVEGKPALPKANWKPNSFNFVGFHLFDGDDDDPEFDEPGFETFFSSSPAHKDQDIYVLENNMWTKVSDPSVSMTKSEGFWIYCNGSSEFTGPLSVILEQSNGLHYGTTLSEQNILLKNNSDYQKEVEISLSSDDVPLYRWIFDPANNNAGWEKIPSDPNEFSITIPPKESKRVRIGVKRAELYAGVEYLSNIVITDEGTLITIPTSVTGISYAGLWVGDATINKVTQPSVNPLTPVKTGSEFSFRIIIHIDDPGNARFLSQVIQMWDGEENKFALLTDDSLIGDPKYSGAGLRDGQPVGRRISAPAFPPLSSSEAMGKEGNLPEIGSNLTITINSDKDTNPFYHKYHKYHSEPYAISRIIKLIFSDVDFDDNVINGILPLTWGSLDMGGKYEETITGLNKPGTDIIIRGTFLLHKVSDIAAITDP